MVTVAVRNASYGKNVIEIRVAADEVQPNQEREQKEERGHCDPAGREC